MRSQPTALVLVQLARPVADAPLGASADHLRLGAPGFLGRVVFPNIAFLFNPAWIMGSDPDLVLVDATALTARYTRVGLGVGCGGRWTPPPRGRRPRRRSARRRIPHLQGLRDVAGRYRGVDLLPPPWSRPLGRASIRRPEAFALRRFLTATSTTR